MLHHRLRGVQKGGAGYRYYRLASTASSSGLWAFSEWRLKIDGVSTSLEGKTITIISGSESGSISAINDGVAETTNGTNITRDSKQHFLP
jgi:hypothetical protein